MGRVASRSPGQFFRLLRRTDDKCPWLSLCTDANGVFHLICLCIQRMLSEQMMVEHDDIKFCVDEAMNLERSPMVVPPRFHDVLFNFDRYPGALGVQGLEGGANCQLYAYEFLREHGFSIGELRSSNLWEDTEYTFEVPDPVPFDLAMVHDKPEAWGAHVHVCVGNNLFLHLSRRIGKPAVESLEEVMARPYYQYLIGFKRCRARA